MDVNFESVTKSFGTILALKNISFKVDSGEFVLLTGPSGAGKSTILKLILRQLRPTSGKIVLDSVDLTTANNKTLEHIRRSIGVVFQDYQLIPDKTVEENIALALAINGLSHKKIPAKIDEVLEKSHLTARKRLFPSQLSGGELQRASLARAISIEPKLILADEPTGNLDEENSTALITLLETINKESKSTIIMTTHKLDYIKHLKKRVLIVDHGELIDSKDTKKHD